MINVNKPYLPDFDKYVDKIKTIWQTNHLTNYGTLHNLLETKIAEYLCLPKICLINNCTNGLLMCLNEFDAGDEIITTPFSFVATTSTIVWSKLKPVFCDIDPEYFFINVDHIESKITSRTKAVIATHVYGNAGNLEKLQEICSKHNIKLIFDAAHAFGVKYKGKSILDYGDASVLSFHATKIYHSIEGGAIYSNKDEELSKYKLKSNFGIFNFEIKDVGINSKMSEFNAAMGLCCLEEIDDIINQRKKIFETYCELLKMKNITIININKDIEWNYSYMPILFKTEKILLESVDRMKKDNILPRRYFYPALNEVCYVQRNETPVASNETPVASDVTRRVLCLPLYYGLIEDDILKIVDCIN